MSKTTPIRSPTETPLISPLQTPKQLPPKLCLGISSSDQERMKLDWFTYKTYKTLRKK